MREGGHKRDVGVQNPWHGIARKPASLTLFKVAFGLSHGFGATVSRIALNRAGSDVGGEQTCP